MAPEGDYDAQQWPTPKPLRHPYSRSNQRGVKRERDVVAVMGEAAHSRCRQDEVRCRCEVSSHVGLGLATSKGHASQRLGIRVWKLKTNTMTTTSTTTDMV